MAGNSGWIYLGSSADCEIRLLGPDVSSYHARCRIDSASRVLVEDLGSTVGTAVNHPSSRGSSHLLTGTETLFLGAQQVHASVLFQKLKVQPANSYPAGPDAAIGPNPHAAPTDRTGAPSAHAGPGAGSPAPPASLRIEYGVTVIGRDPDPVNKQRIPLENPLLSRNHAGLLRTTTNEYYIWDLGSTYGTFVDSVRIGSRRVRVLPGQIIGLASLRVVLGGGQIARAPVGDTLGIVAENVSFEVKTLLSRRLNLENVTLGVAPGTMLALMGPSGAGKTTLLRILAGHSPPRTGAVFYNNLDLYRNFDQLRASLAYVPQEDVLHPQLTVRQAIYFSSRLRLPADYTSAQIAQRVAVIMGRLGIAGQADVRIGSVLLRGISGGQRKRTSLAMELVPDPGILLLDEPTSGLSSADAERVMHILRGLANEDKTVIVTIHQPSREVFDLFDRLAVIDNDTVRISPPPPPQPGRMIYFGPAKAAPAYFQQRDSTRQSLSRHGADAIFTSLDQNPARRTADWEADYRASSFFPQYVGSVSTPANSGSQPAPVRSTRTLPSAFHQFTTLLERIWTIKSSDSMAMWQMLVLQPVLVALGIVIVSGSLHTEDRYADISYVKDFMRIGKTMFFGIFTAVWFGCNNTAREIVGELATLRRERMVGLNLSAYIGSKVVFFSVACLIQCLVLAGVESIGTNLRAHPASMLLLFWLSSVCGASIGLIISALSAEGDRAIQLVPLVLLPMILFGGGVTRLADMDSPVARRIPAVIPARWAFEAALLAENASRPVAINLMPSASSSAPAVGIPDKYTLVHHYFEDSPHNDTRFSLCVALLLSFTIIFVATATVILKFRDSG